MGSGIGDQVPRNGYDGLLQRVAALERALRELRAARTLESASIGAGGLVSADFDGDLQAGTPGDNGWALAGVGGIGIFSQLALRDGSIPPSALASPVIPGQAHASGSGATIAQGSGAVAATASITAPTGYSRAFVLASTRDYGLNSTSSTDWLNSVLTIQPGSTSPFTQTGSSPDCPAGRYTASEALLACQVTDLSSGALVVQSQPATSNGAWAASSRNSVAIDVIALFVR